MNRFTKAEAKFTPSPKNSLLLVYPLMTAADGSSKVRIDVFVRNDNKDKEPEPLGNKKVRLSSTLGSLDKTEFISDKNGQATFYLSSDTPGVAEVSAIVDDTIVLNQKVTVEFK